MTPVLVDSNVILDVATEDPEWSDWSGETRPRTANEAVLIINPQIYAEVCVGFTRIEGLEESIPGELFRRDLLPYEAAFLAGKSFVAYRKRSGDSGSPMPDFCIGAHAVVAGIRLLTRDRTRYRTHTPTVELIAP